MHERRQSSNSNASNPQMETPGRRKSIASDLSTSPSISRYGRSHKLKMQDDFVSTDKKVSAYLKLSPGNQMQYFNAHKEPRKKLSPKKYDKDNPEGTPRRGRPPKTPPKYQIGNEDIFKVTVKVEPQDPASQVDGCEWMVGDLAWARVGGHPFWPCVIALDPVLKIFTKTVRKGRTMVSQRMVHVQFFGDNGRRSWLNTTAIMSYNGRDAFIQLGDTILAGMRKKEPKQTSAFVIKPAVVQVWEKAVQEAEDLVNSTREERIAFFTRNFPPTPPVQFTRQEVISIALSQIESSPKKRGRKRKAEQSPLIEHLKIKQIKLEENSQDDNESAKSSTLEKSNNEKSPLLSSTPRTIADRKKRQHLLMQWARSNQNSPDTSTPVVAASPKPEVDNTSTIPVKQSAVKRLTVKEPASEIVEKKKPKKTYTKKKVAGDFQIYCAKRYDEVASENPEMNEKAINKHLQKLWNEMDESQRGRFVSSFTNQDNKERSEPPEEALEDAESSLIDVEEDLRSSKSGSPTPLAPALSKTTSAKRMNGKSLFSGAKSEKICQICEKTGETVRCRGPCQAYYHPDCITNPPKIQEQVFPTPGKKGKRGRPKKSIESSPASSDTSMSNQSEEQLGIQIGEQVENGRINLKEDIVQVTKKDCVEESSEVNGIPDQSEALPQVEVIEPEVKSSTKVRKGSKDSESAEENEGFRCKDCIEGRSQPCFVCHEYIEKKTGEAKLYRCITAYCGKVYHEECLKPWPQSQWRMNGNGKSCERGVMTCPQHTCHTCASDNPGVIKARYSNDKLVRCVRCPTTYHYGNYCVPAGSEILTNSQIICPQHYQPLKKGLIQHVNAAWCFICASGGSLICCDLCPTSFHADCLKIQLPADGSYVCEECLTGRFPLYGEIVWVKLGTYRWWPAEILYPAMIPDNILNLPHVRGEFAVKFFGSHDHYWVNRGRVFLYQLGDTAGKGNYKKSSVDNMFEKAVKEASEAHCKYVNEKATRDAESRPGMKPPNYVKLKANRPVGNVRTMEMNVSNLTPCECDPKSDNPCAPESDCLNRILMVECNPLVCPAGEKCFNQLFEKRLYPPLQPYQTQERGWGLKTLVDLKKGDFVIEYVGEMIDEEEYKRRVVQMHENNEENFYFLTIDKDRMLDAGPKGNVARFMNHSCQPNCETQKWTVNGDTRVGLFALCDIPANSELVFNYNLESTGSDKKPCMCGAPNCSGFIGVKANKTNKEDKEDIKEKKVVKKKKSTVKVLDKTCFMCFKNGANLLPCDGKLCTKVYHLSCLNKKQRPQGYWLCPWHQCTICNKGRVQRCKICVNSYCAEHAEGNIREVGNGDLFCLKHDQVNNGSDSKIAQNNGVSKTSNKNKTVIEPMEVDEDSSKDSETTLGLSTSELPGNIEPINNNVVKTLGASERRSRRSSSYSGGKPNLDTVVNGAIQKTNKRRNRPSSVDDKLIIASYKQSGDSNSKKISVHRDVSAIINEVISNLPIKEEIDNTEHDIKDNERKEESDLVETTIEEKILKSKCTDRAENHSSSELKTSEINTSDETAVENKHLRQEEHCNSEASTEHTETADKISQDNDPKTEICQLRSSTVEEVSETKYNESCYITNNSHLETSVNGNVDLKTKNNISKNNVLSHFISLESNKIDIDTEKDKEDEDKSDELISEITSKLISPDDNSSNKLLLELNEPIQIAGKAQSDENTSVVPQSCDDHVDDFELAYSENSNDKIYKSVNDSESSIEMKFAGCTSEEDKSVANNLDEITNNSELTNCIEQSNPMQVA